MFVFHGYESLIGLRVYKAVHRCLSVSRAMASCGCFQLPCFVTSKGMTDPNGKWVCLILISAKKKKKKISLRSVQFRDFPLLRVDSSELRMLFNVQFVHDR